MKKIIRRIVTLAILAGAGFGLYKLGNVYLWPEPDHSRIDVVGMLEAPEVNITSRIAGRISELTLLEGDHVHKGQVVCQIEAIDLQNQLRKSEADILHDVAMVNDAQRTLNRDTALLKQNVISMQDHDTAQTNYDEAVATLASARADAAYYRDQLRDTSIVSPVDGVIVNKALEVGEWVTPGTPVLTVDDLSTIWARVDVQETDLRSIYVGKAARVRLPTNPPEYYSGRVMAIGQEANFATERDVRRGRQDIRTFYVKVQVLQAEGALKPGMTAEVAFVRDRTQDTRLTRNTAKESYQPE
jgi:RND family efflux transporter MFP subunit